MLQRLIVALICATGGSLNLSPIAKAQDPPVLFFNTNIVSFNLNGTGAMPLGEGGSEINTTIHMTKVQDHNSSRSNKTSSIVQPPDPDDTDDVNPSIWDTRTFDLFSSINLQFQVEFLDDDQDTDFDTSFGGQLIATSPALPLEEQPLLVGDPSSFVFDADAPDFGMLLAGGARIQSHRGHVTVLKAAFGGSGDDIVFDAGGLELVAVPGSDGYKTLANGMVEHSFDVTMQLSGSYAGQSFDIELEGTVVEQGMLFNNVVPEPSSLLLAAGGLALVVAGRWRRV